MKKILVTGFDPFGNEPINPAIEAVKLLPNEIKGVEIVKLEIPTIRYQSLELIDQTIQAVDPDAILSIGQAGGRFDMTVERVGINQDDFRIPDNGGNQPIDEPVYKDGQAAYFSNLPIKAMVEYMKKANIPASVSNTAGTFACNHVLYGVQYLIDTKYPGKKSGFMHIPFMTQQVVDKPNMPSLDIETMAKGIEAALEAIIDYQAGDIVKGGGATH
ncbi:pyrrolidone-carboxylate peptidase [Erysipelothrix larvae]|uniref:Pyrrolidone-carboxylate peptidase n=1 Tax=Erysipelothrix larvae TaxID=1514105 RepID=A0A109UGM4_9FIRM|nr:pyroglutamyl-peptidase I [Erysipelothrix larvae]AMC92923.1 pyrrolidone-carboxylate peptidase [Erysipelothrix larvae]